MKEQNIFLYENLQKISAIRFHEIKFTGNVKLVNKNHEEGQEYDLEQIIEFNNHWWEVLFNEYYERSVDNRLKNDLKKKDRGLDLLLEINAIEQVIGLLNYCDSQKEYMPPEVYLETVSHLGNELKRLNKSIKFDTTQPLKDQISKIESYKGGLETRYKIQFKEEVSVENVDLQRYYEIKTEIASILQMDDIPDHINMLQWIVYENKARYQINNGKFNKGSRPSTRSS